MKKIRLIVTFVLIAMMLSAMLGCSTTPAASTETTDQPNDSQTAETSTQDAAEPVEIYIYQSKYEIDEALKAACAEYTALYPNVLESWTTRGRVGL